MWCWNVAWLRGFLGGKWGGNVESLQWLEIATLVSSVAGFTKLPVTISFDRNLKNISFRVYETFYLYFAKKNEKSNGLIKMSDYLLEKTSKEVAK